MQIISYAKLGFKCNTLHKYNWNLFHFDLERYYPGKMRLYKNTGKRAWFLYFLLCIANLTYAEHRNVCHNIHKKIQNIFKVFGTNQQGHKGVCRVPQMPALVRGQQKESGEFWKMLYP